MNSYEQELAEVAKKHGMQHPFERASIFMLHLLDQLKNAGVNVTPIGEPDGTLPNFKIEIPALTRTRARTKALHRALHRAGINVASREVTPGCTLWDVTLPPVKACNDDKLHRAHAAEQRTMDRLQNLFAALAEVGIQFEEHPTRVRLKTHQAALMYAQYHQALLQLLDRANIKAEWSAISGWDVGVRKDPSLGHLIKRLIELDVKVYAPGGSTDNWHVVLPEPAYVKHWQQLCNALKAAKVEVVFTGKEYVVTNHAAVVPPVPLPHYQLQEKLDLTEAQLKALQVDWDALTQAMSAANVGWHKVSNGGSWKVHLPISFRPGAEGIIVDMRLGEFCGHLIRVKQSDPGYDLIYSLYRSTLTPPAKA